MANFQYPCDLDSSSLYQLDGIKRLPIHYTLSRINSNNILIWYLIRRSVAHSISDDSIGGLFTKRKKYKFDTS